MIPSFCSKLFKSGIQLPKPVSLFSKMAKRKVEETNGEAKKPKETARSSVDRTITPRNTNITGKHIKIVSANVAGLRGMLNNEAKKANFLKLINQESPDIIGIQEHKLQEVHVEAEGQNMKKILPNYQQYWSCSTNKKGYSGVAFFVRSNEKSGSKQKTVKEMFSKKQDKSSSDNEEDCTNTISVRYGLGKKYENDPIASKEGRVITIELESLFIINVYVPNSGQNLERLDYRTTTWDQALCGYMKELEKTKPVVLIGDLNVAHDIRDIHNFYVKPWFPHKPEEEDEYKGLKSVSIQAGCTKQERDSFTKFLDNGFVDTFRKLFPNASGCFSYWSVRANNRPYNKGLRLDYAVASSKMLDKSENCPQVVDSLIFDDLPAFSDHCPVGCIVTV